MVRSCGPPSRHPMPYHLTRVREWQGRGRPKTNWQENVKTWTGRSATPIKWLRTETSGGGQFRQQFRTHGHRLRDHDDNEFLIYYYM